MVMFYIVPYFTNVHKYSMSLVSEDNVKTSKILKVLW